MFSLLQRLLSRFGAVTLFLLLEGLSFALLVQANENPRRVFSSAVNALGAQVNGFSAWLGSFSELREQNQLLKEEVAKLRTQLAVSFYDNQIRRDTVNQQVDSSFIQKYRFQEAEILSNSISLRNNFLTINRGSSDGITPGMGVISSTGVVGIVRAVSPHYALVMSVLHSQAKISAAIRGKGYFGTLVWNGRDPRYLELQDIPKHTAIKVGDQVETSGFSVYFPAGIPIGKVTAVDLPAGESNFRLQVRLNLAMHQLRTVYIVENLHREELIQLEKKLEADE